MANLAHILQKAHKGLEFCYLQISELAFEVSSNTKYVLTCR